MATFVIEDGTGKSNANSYLSDTDADTYFDNHGAPATWTGAAAVKQAALRMATQYLDAVYITRWRGRRVYPDIQALDWPRVSVEDEDGYYVDSAVLPQQLKDACAELAHRHITESGGLLPDVAAPGSTVTKEMTKVGPITISEEYSGAKGQFKRYILVERILADLVNPSGRLSRS